MNTSDGPVSLTMSDTRAEEVLPNGVGNENQAGGSETDIMAEEKRSVDIDVVMAEIEASASGDETALDEESTDEAASVKEGQLIMEELGRGYDETSY